MATTEEKTRRLTALETAYNEASQRFFEAEERKYKAARVHEGAIDAERRAEEDRQRRLDDWKREKAR